MRSLTSALSTSARFLIFKRKEEKASQAVVTVTVTVTVHGAHGVPARCIDRDLQQFCQTRRGLGLKKRKANKGKQDYLHRPWLRLR